MAPSERLPHEPQSAPTAETSSRLQHFPVSFFSVVMGLSGYVIATRALLRASGYTLPLGAWLPWIPAGVMLVLVGLYGMKCMRHFDAVRAEFNHPVKLSFFPASSISLLLLSIAFLPDAPSLSRALCVAGALLHLCFTVVILGKWVEQQHFSIEHANPSWFIPIVGNILVPVCGVHHLGEELSWFFFSIGAVFWLQLATVLLYRKIFHTPIQEHLSPTFFILVAPPAVGFIAYTHLTAQVDSIARLLLFYGLFMTVLVLYLARRFLRIRFYLSFWAYSFPMAAITIAVLRYEAMTQQAWCRPVALLLYGLLTGIIVMLVVKTLAAVKNRTICMATH